jgi:uncharacterized protein (UPF0264 family)
VDATTARDIVVHVNGRAPISAAAGELCDWPQSAARELLGVKGISHIKLGLAGLAGEDWRGTWRAAGQDIHAKGKQLVAVVYADAEAARAPGPDDVLSAAIGGNHSWVLWDTFDKSAGPLVAHLLTADLTHQLATARAAGLQTVVAGRLDAATVAQLPLELIDMLAVRGAACRGSRDSAVCRERVAHLREAVTRHVDCCLR